MGTCWADSHQAAGLTVTVLSATPPSALKGDALSAYNDCVTSGARIQPLRQRSC